MSEMIRGTWPGSLRTDLDIVFGVRAVRITLVLHTTRCQKWSVVHGLAVFGLPWYSFWRQSSEDYLGFPHCTMSEIGSLVHFSSTACDFSGSFYGALKRTMDKRRKIIIIPKFQKRWQRAYGTQLEREETKCFWVTKNIFSSPSKVSRYWKIGKNNGDVTGDFPAGRP
jgi:hypothetical protein